MRISRDEFSIDSRAMVFRQRATGGNKERYHRPLTARFATPSTFDEWHYLAQLLQARAVGIGLEW
jgi:beta-mannosidase